MAIDKALVPLIADDPDAQVAELEIDVIAMGDAAPAMTINEDGSIEIDLDGAEAAIATDHDANIADFMSDGDLSSLSNELVLEPLRKLGC